MVELARMSRISASTGLSQTLSVRISRAVLVAVAVFALVYVCVVVPREIGRVAPIWFANAVLVAAILRSPWRQSPELLVAGLVANVLGNLASGDGWAVSVALALCNSVEVVALSISLRAALKRRFDPAEPRDLAVFVGLAACASLLSAALASAMLETLRGEPILPDLTVWTLADTLGLVIVTPCVLILREARGYLAEKPLTVPGVGALLLVAATALAMMGQSHTPLLFVAPAVLLIAATTLEVFGAAVAVLLLTAISLGLLAAGHGPAALMHTSRTEKIILLQLFLALSTIFSLVTAAQHVQRRRLREILAKARDAAQAQARRAQAAEAEMARSETRYRLLAEQATDIIIHVDLDDVIQYASAACRRLGYEPTELIGEPSAALVHPHDAARLGRMISAALQDASPPPPAEREYRLRSKDRRWVWMEGSPSLVRDDRGAVIGLVSLLRDITQRKEIEARLADALAAAEAAAEAKSEFLANVSHELRTPLTAILGFSSLLSEEPELTHSGQGYARRIAGASRALLTAVNDILDFSEVEAGRVRTAWRPLRPMLLAQEAMEVLTPEAGAKGLVMRVVAHDVPACVQADEERVRQVLLNLIGNAVKFTHAGGVTLRLAYAPLASTLRVSVIDTGMGVAPGDAGRLFQRFSQIDNSARRGHGGTGLGLAISKGVVEAMNGRIGMRPNPEGGSEFWFEIPAPALPDDAAHEAARTDISALSGVRVLVVDDQADTRNLVRGMLEPSDVELTEAEDGLIACALAAEAAFDVILMDLDMPRLDGREAAMRIRHARGPNQDTPIVAFTAARGGVEFTASPMTCFDDYLEKPASRDGMTSMLKKWAL
jgi:PAS domain S-box-containing protein